MRWPCPVHRFHQFVDAALHDLLRGLQGLAGTEPGFRGGDVACLACINFRKCFLKFVSALPLPRTVRPFDSRFDRLRERHLLAGRRLLALVVLVALDLQGVEVVQPLQKEP